MTRRSEPSTALRIIQAVRIAAALLLLAGLAGAAASAARRESLATFRADLDAGRVTEVLLAGPGSYLPPGAATDSGRFGRTVRWEVTGGGRRVADRGRHPARRRRAAAGGLARRLISRPGRAGGTAPPGTGRRRSAASVKAALAAGLAPVAWKSENAADWLT